ncbi:MAG: M20 peptidase family dipeptidase, partial [Pseudomonadota bacterium]
MTREAATAAAQALVDRGTFQTHLATLVAHPTESQAEGSAPALHAYLTEGIRPLLDPMGFEHRIFPNPAGPFPVQLSTRIEDPGLPTVLIYGHGDTVREMAGEWGPGRTAWTLATE